MRILIIGAGMAGLACARQLQAEGHEAVLVDKGRVVGGRMATRRHGGATFDHGAQHFSARTPAFDELRRSLVADAVARVWLRTHSVADPDRGVESRFVGAGGMRRVPEALADGLVVHTQVQIARLSVDGHRVAGVADDGRVFGADAVVCTAPAPQALAMLQESGLGVLAPVRDVVSGLRYEPCLAVMALPRGPIALPAGHWAGASGPVAWIGDNQHKGASKVPAVTVHASAEYSRRYLESEPSEWLPPVIAETTQVLGSEVEVVRTHRWRYSNPIGPLDVGALEVASAPFPLVLAGDIYAGARVEGAFSSGLAAARAVASRA